jgi:hypothetical protein
VTHQERGINEFSVALQIAVQRKIDTGDIDTGGPLWMEELYSPALG